MSRAALWRQEAGVQERQRKAQEVFERVVEEGRSGKKKQLPLHDNNDSSFHIHPVLLESIIQSPYFTNKCCGEILDWNALVDEIYYSVKHVEPWAAGKCHNIV